MIIEVKEFKGLATNADPSDIGLEFSRVNENFRLDTPGTLTKQKGRGGNTDIASTRLTQLQYWSPSNLTTANAVIPSIWVGFDDVNNKIKKLDSNFTNPKDLGTAIADVSSVDLNDHGQDFRISPDNLTHSTKILQHISRKFFEGNDTLDEYVVQDATPSYPSTAELDFQSLTAVTLGANTGLNISNNTFNYKINPIFDGNQELPLPSNFRTISTGDETKCAKVSIRIPNQSGTGTVPNKTYAFNPRTTSVKIYRETGNDDNYYQIGEVPINTSNDTDNIIFKNKTVYEGNGHVFSNTFIDEYTSLVSASQIFDAPDYSYSSGALSIRYKWFILGKNDDGTDDAVNAMNNSSQIFSDVVLTNTSGNTYSTSSSNAPRSNSTFTALLQKGIVQATSIASSHNDFFNQGSKIVRVVQVTALNGSVITPANGITTRDIFNTVQSTKALIYDMPDADRFGINGANGYIAVDASDGQRVVLESVGKAVRLDSIGAYSDSDSVDLYKDYVLTRDNTHSVLHFYDIGYTNSFLPPFNNTDATIDTRYKYSQMIGDMHFVGNVRLDPNGNPEDHPDFVMYSEPGQPDIIPTTNFIRILDQQGGFINGLNRILNNLVVFMTRGVFRLDVSSGDPSLFTLLEVNTSVGCVASESIVNAKDNLFFCSKDNMYQIRPDFTFVAISKPIEDVYQGVSTIASSKVMYDVKRDRLICRFGNDALNIYCYDLLTQDWTKMVFNDGSVEQADFFTANDDLDLYSVRVYDPNPSP